jgi:hypothetical protein
MTRWIIIYDRIIIHIRVPIPRLCALRPGRDDGVGGGETSQRGVHPARFEIINSERGLFSLTGELVVRAEIAESIPCFSKRLVQRGRGLDSARVRGDGRTAEVVTEQVGECPARADGDSGRNC